MNTQNDTSNLNTVDSDTVKTSTENLADNATNETRQVLLTWSDGQTTETSRQVLNKFKAIYGENPKCKIEIR